MKKIAIVCGAPSSVHLAPYDDPDWKIWVLGNRLNKFAGKEIDRVFEIHDNLTEHGDVQKYAEWLVSHNIPMTVGEKFPVQAPHVKAFDYAASEALFGSLYLTSSPSYMMSQAILEGATHIGIYGVDLAVDDHEYFWQRPCMEAWIGFAKGRGIVIDIPSVSAVGRCDYVEGRDWDGKKNHTQRKTGNLPFTQDEFLKMAEQHDAKGEEHEKQLCAHQGAADAYRRMAKVARASEAGNDIKNLSDSSAIR